jgi:hypothetical protein
LQIGRFNDRETPMECNEEIDEDSLDGLSAAISDIRDGVVKMGLALRGRDPTDPLFDELLRLDRAVDRLDGHLDLA